MRVGRLASRNGILAPKAIMLRISATNKRGAEPMSALGQEQPFLSGRPNVRFAPKAVIQNALDDGAPSVVGKKKAGARVSRTGLGKRLTRYGATRPQLPGASLGLPL
jgi:hypothetical protein